MDRKSFLKTCGLACGGVAVMSLLMESCNAAYYAQTTNVNNTVLLKKSEFTKVDGDKKGQRKFVLVKSDKYNFPICVYKHSDNEFTALLLECTHKGCEVKPNTEFLVCPCHGSEFSNKGVVLNPPAEKNLQQFKITLDNENITIAL